MPQFARLPVFGVFAHVVKSPGPRCGVLRMFCVSTPRALHRPRLGAVHTGLGACGGCALSCEGAHASVQSDLLIKENETFFIANRCGFSNFVIFKHFLSVIVV